MPPRYEDSLRVLGLEPGATEQAVKDAYRDLVKVWHPDRFGSDERLREKAQDKLREVNAAFEQLRGYSPSDSRRRTGRPRPAEPARPQDRGRDFGGWDAPASPRSQRTSRRPSYVLLLVLFAVMAGFVGTGLVMFRDPGAGQSLPANEPVQAPAPLSTTRVPSAPQPVKREPPPASAATHESPAPATGSLLVSSRPTGAHVSFDGRVVGETPLTVTDVEPGEHRLEVTLDGHAYQPWSSSVVVTAGQEEKLLAIMTPTARKR